MKNPTETELIIKKPRAPRVKKPVDALDAAPEVEALEKIDMGRNPHAYNYGVDPNAETEVHLLDYWRAVRKRLWLVISMVVSGHDAVRPLCGSQARHLPGRALACRWISRTMQTLVGSKAPYVFGPTNDPVYFNTQLQILVSPGLHAPRRQDSRPRAQPRLLQRRLHSEAIHLADHQTNGWLRRRRQAGSQRATKRSIAAQHHCCAATDQGGPGGGETTRSLRRRNSRRLEGRSGKGNARLYKETRLIDISFTHTDPRLRPRSSMRSPRLTSSTISKRKVKPTPAPEIFCRSASPNCNNKSAQTKSAWLTTPRTIRSFRSMQNQNTVVERLAALNTQVARGREGTDRR